MPKRVLASDQNQPVTWERFGKGSAVTLPLGAIAVFVWQIFGGYVDEIQKDIEAKASIESVNNLQVAVSDYGEDIDELKEEQTEQGKQLKAIETRQEQVIKGQDRILEILEDRDRDRDRDRDQRR